MILYEFAIVANEIDFVGNDSISMTSIGMMSSFCEYNNTLLTVSSANNSITFLIKNVLFPAAKFGRKVDNAMKKSFTQPKYNIFIINNLPSS